MINKKMLDVHIEFLYSLEFTLCFLANEKSCQTCSKCPNLPNFVSI